MNYPVTYSDLYDPAFPQSTLDVRTELQLGGVWTDVTPLHYNRADVVVTRGHADETSTVQPQTGTLQLNNRSGNLSPRNPLGAFYGLLGKNTPLRLSLPDPVCALRLEQDSVSYASCPTRSSLNTTGDIDVRIDMQLTSYGRITLATKWTSATDRAWALWLNPDGTLVMEFIDNATVDHFATSSMPIPLGRLAVRATVQVNNGSGGHTTTFYTAPTIAGPWTQLGNAFPAGTTLTLATSTGPIAVGFSVGYIVTDAGHPTTGGPNGRFFAFQLYNGIAGTLVASPNFTTQVPGTSAFADGQANPWSMAGTATIDNRKYRLHGEVPAWPQRWDTTGKDVYVPVEAAGLLRRLTQGTQPSYSAMLRGYNTLTGAAIPVGYWPCEDGSNSTLIGSALPGGDPMQIRGAPSFAANSSFVCSQPIPSLNGSTWFGTVGGSSTWTSNTCRFLMQIPSGGEANGSVIARMYTAGSVPRFDLIYGTGGTLAVAGYATNGAQLFTSGAFTFNANGAVVRASFELKTSGANLIWSVATLAVGATVGGIGSGTLTGATLGAVSTVVVNPDGQLTGTAIGHISVQTEPTDLFGTLYGPLNANNGEAAPVRFARLCTEQGLPARVYGHPAIGAVMGYQSPGTFVALLQECEDVDRGLIFEPRQTLGLGYRTFASMCNQTAAVTLSYTGAQLSPPIEPTDDDQFTVNDVTVTRSTGPVTGSSARVLLPSGALSVQAPPNGIGEYATALSLNLFSDGQAMQLAGWIMHVGTVDQPRYPTLTVNLARSELAALYYQVQDLEVGDVLAATGTPVWLPPDGISQVVRGMTETLNTFTLTEAFVCAPSAPYTVGVYNDAVLGHYDTDGSTVHGNPTATATSIQVSTTNATSPLWTTVGGDFPFDIEVSIGGTSGERMTVTNITGSASPQTFTVTRSVNAVVRAWPNGADVRLFQPAIYSL